MTTSRSSIRGAGILLFCLAAFPGVSVADNPVVQTNYTADPAPMVYDGKVYLYTSHDEDVTVNNFFTMNDWRVYSSADMVNWTDHGSPLSYKDFTWAKGDAWAGQCIHRNGKFYYYVPVTQKSGGGAIAVAVATSPTGPFKDALGKPLATTGTGDIDPSVFIDDDGQAYLYWGNPKLWYVKLNEDMISYPGRPTEVSLTTAGFGKRSNSDRATAYEEGPWFYQREGRYYIVYPGDGVPENLSYTTSTGPLGPWTFQGVIMDKNQPKSAFTNHPGVIDFKGNSYLFYHNGALPGGGGYKRSVCIEPFTYKADGSIPKMTMTTAGASAVAHLNPFVQVEAETIAWSVGLKTETCSEGGLNVTQISNGDYIKVKSVEMGSGATSMEARVASAQSGGSIEVRLDSDSGTKVGTCEVKGTGGAQTWATVTCPLTGASGLHDVVFKFVGGSGELFKFNWWKMSGPGMADVGGADGGVPSGSDAGVGGSGGRDGGATGAGGRGGSGGRGGGGTAASGGSQGGKTGSAGGSTPTAGSSASAGNGAGGSSSSAGGSSSSARGGSSSSAGKSSSSAAGGKGGESGSASSFSAEGDGGCSCQSGPGRAPGGFALLAFMLLVLDRGRRRRGLR